MKPGIYFPTHPGEVLKNEINSSGSTIQAAADAIGISRKHLSLVLNGHSGVSVEIAVRISKVLGHTPEFWLNMQMAWDLSQIKREEIRVGKLK